MPDEKTLQRLHVSVRGHVQGVGFRYFVLNAANAMGLSGWVRNCPDGSVEVTAEGEFEALESLLQKLRNGPRMGLVSDVVYQWSPCRFEFDHFMVR